MGYGTKNELLDERILIPNTDQYDNGHITDSTILSFAMLQWIDMHSENVIVVCDIDREVVFVSQSVKRVLGYSPTDLIGKNAAELISARDKIHLEKKFDNDISKLQDEWITINVKNAKGAYCPLNCKFEKVSIDKKTFIFSELKDGSEDVKSRERLIESEKMSIAGQFAAGIVHEIRNPLTSIKGFLQLLQSGVKQKDAYYKIMIDEIDKLEAITSELLFISKPLTNKKKIENVHSMISDVMVLLNSQAKLKTIKWETEQMNKEAEIYCDRSQIKQVLINIIKNAIEAIDQSGMIKIEVNKIDSQIEVTIADNGVGIEEDMIPKMNEPFFTTKESGTGLGLMISKQILDQHDATINFCRNENGGCTVRILFPAM